MGLPARAATLQALRDCAHWNLTLQAVAEPQRRKTGGGHMLHRAIRAGKALLKDESGQTMLEYIVIVVFVVIAAIVAFKVVKGIVSRGVNKASASIG
jgi:Flp pilus assembly pilin Flp